MDELPEARPHVDRSYVDEMLLYFSTERASEYMVKDQNPGRVLPCVC
jgi:hypothetical protein